MEVRWWRWVDEVMGGECGDEARKKEQSSGWRRLLFSAQSDEKGTTYEWRNNVYLTRANFKIWSVRESILCGNHTIYINLHFITGKLPLFGIANDMHKPNFSCEWEFHAFRGFFDSLVALEAFSCYINFRFAFTLRMYIIVWSISTYHFALND